jgi:hypothetical protein
VVFPDDIRNDVVSKSNPDGRLTNSDLELAATVMHLGVLERIADVRHRRAVVHSDNSPSVIWATKLSARSATPVAYNLLRGLAMRQRTTRAVMPTVLPVEGHKNPLADVASRQIKVASRIVARPADDYMNQPSSGIDDPRDVHFLTYFSSRFPLQTSSWRIVHPITSMLSNVILESAWEMLGAATVDQASRKHSWDSWLRSLHQFPKLRHDPHLSKLSKGKQQQIFLAFAARTRTGYYGRKKQVGSQQVQKALRHVAQAAVMAGYPDPRRTYGAKELDLPFNHLNKAYRDADPAPQP